MDDLQYNKNGLVCNVIRKVLNLVINGWPSIPSSLSLRIFLIS